MIETNEPTTETPGQAKPPESDLVQTARDAAAAAQERFGGLREEAMSGLDQAKSAASEKAGEAKAQAADEINRTARGFEKAAEEMEGSPLQQDLLREAADGLKQIAHAVEGKSLGAMASDLSEFGRQNPVAYLGGAALVGFALARFARASTPAQTASSSSSASRFDAGTARRWSDDNRPGGDLASADFAGGSDNG